MSHLTISVGVLFALVICVLAHGPHGPHGPPPHVKATIMECINEMGGNESTMEKVSRHEDISADPQFRCLNACVMKKMHYMDDSGTVTKNKAIDSIPSDLPNREQVVDAINVCFDEKGSDDCDTGARIKKCMMEKHLEESRMEGGN